MKSQPVHPHQHVVDTYRSAGTLRAAAERLGISHERVRQIVAKHAPGTVYPPHIPRGSRA